MLHVIVMKFPGAMDHFAAFINLIRRQRRAFGRAMRTDRHNVCRAVRQPDACEGLVIFGSVTQKLSGNLPPLSSRSVETKRSSVRMLLARNSSLNGLIRMPMKGGRVPAAIPFATPIAADSA